MASNVLSFLLSLLAVIVIASADEQSRPDDIANITSPLNTTKSWSTSLVAAANPVEEDILKFERDREKSVSNLGKESQEQDESPPGLPEGPHLEEDIVNREKNRELDLNENVETFSFIEPNDFMNTEYGKQLNDSMNPDEEKILREETDRDKSIANIFRSGSDQMKEHGADYKTNFGDEGREMSNDEPKFEFLIGAVPVQLSTTRVSEEITTTRKPFVPPKSAWPVPQAQFLTTEPKFNATSATPIKRPRPSSTEGAEDYVELVEIGKNISVDNSGFMSNRSVVYGPQPNNLNRTVYYVENDGPDGIFSMFAGFTDLQTLFLACFATLVPLFIALMLACILRLAWRRYRRGGRRGYGPGLRSENGGSTDPITDKREHSNDLKSAESGFSNRNGEAKEMTANSTSPTQQNQPANGSIITMTLKNNHLIVETEVRDDIMQGCRETKMKYSSNNDGVFVVEVQQSNSLAQGSPERRALVHHSPIANAPNGATEESQENLNSVPPPSNKPEFGSTNTGLSTSDLSLSSAGSHNPSYAYGNQVGYEQGQYGYPVYAGYIPPPIAKLSCESSREPLITKSPTDIDKPVVTGAIFKQDSLIAAEDGIKTGEYNIEGSTDGPLLSDIQARELSLHKLQDKLTEGCPKTKMIANLDSAPASDTEEEKHQEQQRQLGNGKEQTVVEINHDKSGHSFHRADSLPPRLIHEQTIDATTNNVDNFDIIEEESSVIDCYPGDIASGSPLLCHSAGIAAANARHKRASLPIITPDLYSSIKQTTKSILPTHSPKFEKLSNEHSPMENCDRQTSSPLITVTEEVDDVETEDSVSPN